MTDPTIRLATTADVRGIQRLFTQGDAHHARLLPDVFRPAGEARPDELMESQIESPDSDYLVAAAGSRIVGFLNLAEDSRPAHPIFVPKRFAVVESMVVAEEFRDRGIGTRLLEEAEAWARARGLESVQLNVWADNLAAIRLYQRLGYETISQKMELDLQGSGASDRVVRP
jgi:shikimate dehydrogenase